MDQELARITELIKGIDKIGDRVELRQLLDKCEQALGKYKAKASADDDKDMLEQLASAKGFLESETAKWYAKESRYERALIITLVGMMVVALFIVARLMASRK